MRRRNATTEFLKECIADALLKLLQEGNAFNEITIQEITDLADVGRVTYYRNFNSKEDVINFKFSLLAQRWLTTCSPTGMQNINQISKDWFRFILSIRSTLEILYNAGLEHLALENFFAITISKFNLADQTTEKKSAKAAYGDVFIAFGLCGITSEWIRRGFKESPTAMAKMFPMELPKQFQIKPTD